MLTHFPNCLSLFVIGMKQREDNGSRSLSLANESQFLLVNRESVSELLNNVNQDQPLTPSYLVTVVSFSCH